MGGGVTISKDTFYIPGLTAYDGRTFRLWPDFLVSTGFAAGGHEWSITYFPDSLYDHDSFDLCLRLESEGARVTISSAVGLVDPTGTLPPLNLVPPSPPLDFDSHDSCRRMISHWVPKSLMTRTLHQSYGQGRGGLMFEWTITVLPQTTPMQMPEPVLPLPTMLMPILEQFIPKPKLKIVKDDVASTPNNVPATTTDLAPSLHTTTSTTEVAPPLPKVLPSTDVTFSVGGELFHAHKAILCMRSPVFMEELSGTPPWTTMEVDGMSPDVFEALLHYVYTDTLPGDTEEDESDDDASQMMTMTTTRSLLVVADQYGMDELKGLCEERLVKMVDADNVADMLALADEQFCVVLKDACIGYMMAPGRMRDVVASQGYQRLRVKHPSILVDVLEKSLIYVSSTLRTAQQCTS